MNEKLYQEILHGCLDSIRAWKQERGESLPIQYGDYLTHCYNYGSTYLHDKIDELMDGLDEESESDLTHRLDYAMMVENIGYKEAERIRIGERIATLRNEQGITQSQLAERTGLQQSHIARVEAGKYSVGLDTLANLAKALGTTIDFV